MVGGAAIKSRVMGGQNCRRAGQGLGTMQDSDGGLGRAWE